MDAMKEALKRRMMKGLDITISVVPAPMSPEEKQAEAKASDLAPNPEEEMEMGEENEGEDMEVPMKEGEETGPSLFARGLREQKAKKGMK